VVSVRHSEAMVAALQAVDAPIKFTVYPGVHHDSWTQTYENPELYDWLLGQRAHSGGAEGGASHEQAQGPGRSG
jgi:acetyl esterase/lipase